EADRVVIALEDRGAHRDAAADLRDDSLLAGESVAAEPVFQLDEPAVRRPFLPAAVLSKPREKRQRALAKRAGREPGVDRLQQHPRDEDHGGDDPEGTVQPAGLVEHVAETGRDREPPCPAIEYSKLRQRRTARREADQERRGDDAENRQARGLGQRVLHGGGFGIGQRLGGEAPPAQQKSSTPDRAGERHARVAGSSVASDLSPRRATYTMLACGGRQRALRQPDRHDDAEEALEGLEDAGADLVLQLEVDLVLRE